MKITPNLNEFKKLSDQYDLIAVRTELTADTETPLSAYLKLSKNKPAFLFESVVGGEQVSRFSFLGFSASKQFICNHDFTDIIGTSDNTNKIQTPEDPLKLIEDEIEGIKYKGIDGPGTPEALLDVYMIASSGQETLFTVVVKSTRFLFLIACAYLSDLVNEFVFVFCLFPAYFKISAFLLISNCC